MSFDFHGYERLMPKRDWAHATIRLHQFGVLNPWWQPYELIVTRSGQLRRIEPSSFCELFYEGVRRPLLIPLAVDPILADAVIGLGKLLLTGGREERFMTLFKVYEAIHPNPEMQFAAVRHALAHATIVLDRPKTVSALLTLFGTTRIDLSEHTHRKIFWRVLGDLLINVDTLLTSKIELSVNQFRMLDEVAQPLTVSVASHYFSKEFGELPSNRSFEPTALSKPRSMAQLQRWAPKLPCSPC
jgi:hypothetical protein